MKPKHACRQETPCNCTRQRRSPSIPIFIYSCVAAGVTHGSTAVERSQRPRPVKKSERPTSNSGSNTSHYGNHFRHNHWYHGWGHRQVPHARKGSRWLDYHNLNWFSWLVPRHISRTSSWFISYGRACWFYRVNPWGDYPSFTLPAGGQTTHVIRARCQACLKPLFSTWMGCFAHPVDFHRGRFPRGGPARRKFQSTMPR
jgi:hypothetical protein